MKKIGREKKKSHITSTHPRNQQGWDHHRRSQRQYVMLKAQSDRFSYNQNTTINSNMGQFFWLYIHIEKNSNRERKKKRRVGANLAYPKMGWSQCSTQSPGADPWADGWSPLAWNPSSSLRPPKPQATEQKKSTKTREKNRNFFSSLCKTTWKFRISTPRWNFGEGYAQKESIAERRKGRIGRKYEGHWDEMERKGEWGGGGGKRWRWLA